MRTDERHEPEPGPSVVVGADLLDRAIGGPRLHGAISRLRAHLRHVVHLRTLAHELLQVVVLGMLAGKPRRVGVGRAVLGRRVELLAVQVDVVAERFAARAGMKLADAEGAVTELPHDRGEVRPAAALDRVGLTGRRPGDAVAEDPGGRRLAAGADRVAGRHAHRAGGVGVGEAHPATDQPVQVGSVDVPVAEGRDRVEPLLVGHDEEHVRLAVFHPVRCLRAVGQCVRAGGGASSTARWAPRRSTSRRTSRGSRSAASAPPATAIAAPMPAA